MYCCEYEKCESGKSRVYELMPIKLKLWLTHDELQSGKSRVYELMPIKLKLWLTHDELGFGIVYCCFVMNLDIMSLGGWLRPSNLYLKKLKMSSHDGPLIVDCKRILVFVNYLWTLKSFKRLFTHFRWSLSP